MSWFAKAACCEGVIPCVFRPCARPAAFICPRAPAFMFEAPVSCASCACVMLPPPPPS